MLSEKNILRLKKLVRSKFPEKSQKIFIFGSALRKEKFHDIDVAFEGSFPQKKLDELEEFLEESTFPYIVDIVNFSKTSKGFSQYVTLSEKKIWI